MIVNYLLDLYVGDGGKMSRETDDIGSLNGG